MKRWALMGSGVLALACWPVVAGASGDYGCTPDWKLATSAYDCAGTALISPRNDTRLNLALLLRERAGLSAPGKLAYPAADWENASYGHVFVSWDGLRAAFWPSTVSATDAGDDNSAADYAGSRCQTLASGGVAFRAALARAKGLSEGDRTQLAGARDLVKPACDGNKAPAAWPGVTSPAAREWLGYLQGARAFYADDFSAARGFFGAVSGSRDPWLAETGRYMVARNELAAAQAGAIDEWGGFAGTDKVDKAAAARGGKALADYISGYPHGLYTDSAIGLQRRALWLSGDGTALARSYQALLPVRSPLDPQVLDTIEEVEAKSLFGVGLPGSPEAPLLLATWDLLRMRASAPDMAQYVPKPLTADELAGQEGAFAKDKALYAYLQASFAYHVTRDDRRVLALVPDNTRAGSFTPVAFGSQMLRGLALERLKDRNVAGFWKQLVGGAQDLYQRPAVELAWAMNRERSGALAEVFAKDSVVTQTDLRVRLLEHVAGPDLLRTQAAAKDRWERETALFILLAKELSRGRYGAFGKDLGLVPASASTEGWLGGWHDDSDRKVPLGVFAKGKSQEDYACPALARTAATLAAGPADVKAQLCLAEFYRLNGFDDWLANPGKPAANQLGGSPELFPGKAVPRAALYAAVLGNRSAGAEDTAYALYRSVQCYAPSRNNSCGGEDVPEAQRRAWFQRLKRDYPKSQWAIALKYYW